jgi:thiamine-phosphate pyrophosphorylase
VVQLRLKGASKTERVDWLHAVLPILNAADVLCVLNDDWELAAATPGVGLHIGQDDAPVEHCREALGPDRIVGLSTHSQNQAQAAIEQAHLLDYFAVGPVFSTQTKPDYEPVGLGLVRHVAASKPPLPWFCIGGVNRQTLPQVIEAGGRAVVVVSDILCDRSPKASLQSILKTLDLRHFDEPGMR